MKKLIVVLAAVVAFGAAAGLVLQGTSAEAGCTACLPAGTTSAVTGSGSSCAQADQNAINGAMAQVPGGACINKYIEVTPCYVVYVDRPIYYSKWKIRWGYMENVCQ